MRLALIAALGFLVLGGRPAAAEEPQRAEDRRGSFSLLVENDAFIATDRHYTNGLRASWLSAEDDVPAWGRWLARNMPLIDPGRRLRIGYAVGQSMFTPNDIDVAALQPDERPYAGWLYGEVGLTSETDARMDQIALSLGVVGPLSLAENTQRFWHETFGFQDPKGWDNQLENEPAINLFVERKWRNLWRHAPLLGLETDVTPHLGGSLGNVFTYAAAGLTVRLGVDLEDDFGPPRIRPSLPGSAFFTPRSHFAWYLFAGLEGRAVAHNIFLDGNTFADSHSVDRETWVADVQIGLALLFERVRLTFTVVERSPEFEGQGDPDRFGAISATARF